MTRELEERVLAYLREHQGAGPREIADALGEPLQRVRAALARLRDRGLVARGDEGHYYAVAPAVKGPAPRELRRRISHRQKPDLEALWEHIAILEERLRKLEEEIKRLRESCGLGGADRAAKQGGPSGG